MAIYTDAQLRAHLELSPPVKPDFHSQDPTLNASHHNLMAFRKSLNSLETELNELEEPPLSFDHRLRVWIFSQDLRRLWRSLGKIDDKLQAGVDAQRVKVEDPTRRMKDIMQLEKFVGELGKRLKGLQCRLLMVKQALPPTKVQSALEMVGNTARRVIGKV